MTAEGTFEHGLSTLQRPTDADPERWAAVRARLREARERRARPGRDDKIVAGWNGWLIDATGVDIRELPAIGLVAETSCRFLAALSFPDSVVAGLSLERLGRTSVVYRIGLFRGDEIAPAAIGRFVHVYVDAETRRPTPVPDEIRAVVEALGQ